MKHPLGLFAFFGSAVLCSVLGGACSSFDGDGSGDTPGGDDAGADRLVTGSSPTCDPSEDTKDPNGCVADEHGLFVDSFSGDDGNNGTKKSPLRSISAALASSTDKPNIYVCEGTYAEHLTNARAASIFGGYACADWSYSGIKAKVVPTDAGVVLSLTQVRDSVIVSDLEITAPPGNGAITSSVGVFVGSAKAVKLRRLSVTAGAGAKGRNGVRGDSGSIVKVSSGSTVSTGVSGSGLNGGAAKTCTCGNGATSTGAKGGDAAGTTDGADGMPAYASMPAGGKGQTAAECAVGGAGSMGAEAPVPTDATPPPVATIDAAGWHAGDGGDGTIGNAGQGGGGGGGAAGGGGGGGGCGACPGTGGGGGKAGGSSIALVTFESTVVLTASTFTSGVPADAGDGALGGGAQSGGMEGTGVGGGCSGGRGGSSSDGAAGSGGAGGVSAAIAYRGTKPMADGTTLLTVGSTVGGKGGNGGNGLNDGPDGITGEALLF